MNLIKLRRIDRRINEAIKQDGNDCVEMIVLYTFIKILFKIEECDVIIMKLINFFLAIICNLKMLVYIGRNNSVLSPRRKS